MHLPVKWWSILVVFQDIPMLSLSNCFTTAPQALIYSRGGSAQLNRISPRLQTSNPCSSLSLGVHSNRWSAQQRYEVMTGICWCGQQLATMAQVLHNITIYEISVCYAIQQFANKRRAWVEKEAQVWSDNNRDSEWATMQGKPTFSSATTLGWKKQHLSLNICLQSWLPEHN